MSRRTCKTIKEEDIKALLHDASNRDLSIEDDFRQWVKTQQPSLWAKNDLHAVGLGWNAAINRVLEMYNV